MPTTEELLARSAQEKLRTGQKPNKTELNALENMKNAAAMERLRSVSPRFFNELFGFTGNKSRFDWEKQYEIPCGQGRKTINMFDVFIAIRRLIANNRKYIGSGSAKPGELTDDQIDLLEA